ncbi:hypothetical protein B0A55_05196 [Friedmanniomyces simplex]|uniref:Carboxypeptidase n=1 Tax=Friedmanniomyces simplex TaxID=329884 RepID=A0A4U0XM04_9PEZI|nr:hypothetical protein B0A55_05196 [Friedmanniomyces simplex]
MKAINMLYLDQPVQVGFYDVLQNVTKPKLKSCGAGLVNATDPVPKQNTSMGTYPSQNPNTTSLGTRNAAIALWQFSQTWFQEFPEYHSSRISLATESYGGRYGPEIFRFFEEQNQRIRNGSSDVPGETFVLRLDTVMIINGWVDSLIQWPTQPQIAYNNTYGIETINATIYQRMLEVLDRPGGCNDQTYGCRKAASLYDPNNIGINETVNAICKAAYDFCFINLGRLYAESSAHGFYDYGTLNTDPGPPIIQPFHEAFLNQPHVQSALGVPLNYTGFSLAAWQAFSSTGDFQRSSSLDDLAYLLDKGVKVALLTLSSPHNLQVYGDRDFVCNWLGGEAVSLAINHTDSDHFRHAGYSPIQTNETYIGGQVRQYGNLSFSCVYEAGHAAAAYQPETVYRIFQRALFNKDIATGAMSTLDGSYTSTGPSDTWAIKNEPPSPRSG